ncbi:uncharacterized protein LOC114319692 [Camellia sinensis]|uniref:uncharacterized protein LOC114319692 n=1 Tax=Camellia sinensis TaxID=4442 RepID=UPI001036F2E7|nr:uncharacterized protein LOC114319692 [Camellia sinensis]
MLTTKNRREMATANGIIEHFRRKHRLDLREEASPTARCEVCRQHGDEDDILGSLYRCTDGCKIVIHKSCSAIPPVLFCKPQQQPPVLICKKKQQQQEHHNHFHPQHPLFLAHYTYPECYACGRLFPLNVMAYICLELECSFQIHVRCSFLTPISSSSSSKTIEAQARDDHHHPHPLILCDPPPKIYTYYCSCCCLPFNEQTPVYVCLEECKALLHKSCAELPSKLHHPLHPLHPLTLLVPSRNPERYDFNEFWACWACHRHWSFVYHCFDCKFYLDVACATYLQPTTTAAAAENNEEEDQDQDHRQFTHSHPLILCHNKQQFPIPCCACNLPLGDSVYLCPTCHILIHESCAQMPREIKHPLHPPHPLNLVDDRPSFETCEGCLSHIHSDFAYVCSHCEFNLDVRCAFSKPTTMMSKIHHHPLAFFNETPRLMEKLICNACDKPCYNPCFRCAWCELNLHVHCIPTLPPTVKSRFHRHPLTLVKFPIKDHPDEDDNAEFYCDDCEKHRWLPEPSYYCCECHYVAHPHCVASEIMRILEEEWSEEESHKCASEVEEPPSQILEEFLDSFKGDETKEAQGVFEDYNRASQRGAQGVFEGYNRARQRGVFKDYDRESQRGSTKYRLYLGEVTTQVMKMLVSKNKITKMPWENWNSTSKLIKVNNYMILENLASILKALFGKYGDFIGKSGLSRKVKMLYIMTVCDAIDSMCNTKVVDITANVLVSRFHSFMLGQYAGFEIEFAFDRLKRVVRAHFGLQANNIPIDPNCVRLFVEIAKHGDPPTGAAIDSKEELAVIEQDGGTNELNEMVVSSMKLAIIKLDEEIREVEKIVKEKHALRIMWEECFKDAVALLGEMAGTSLC